MEEWLKSLMPKMFEDIIARRTYDSTRAQNTRLLRCNYSYSISPDSSQRSPSFSEQIFIECLLYGRCYIRLEECSNEYIRQTKPPASWAAASVRGGVTSSGTPLFESGAPTLVCPSTPWASTGHSHFIGGISMSAAP